MEALVIAPLDDYAKPLRDTIQQCLEEVGVSVRSAPLEDDASSSSVVMDAITSADLVIADVSRENPNVFYELGYAHALRKNTILLASREASPNLPSDLSGMFYLTYDPHNLDELRPYLQHQVFGLKQRRKALA